MDRKRFFDNPYPQEHDTAGSFVESVTLPPNSENGYRTLDPESPLGAKVRKASEKSFNIVHEAYFPKSNKKGRQVDYSVYTGLSGILYLIKEFGKDVDESLIEESCGCKSLRKRLGYLGGISGPLAFASTVSAHKSDYVRSLLKLKDSALFKDSPEEFLYGKAGYLYALLLVKRSHPDSGEIDEAIKYVIEVLLQKGRSPNKSLSYEWHGKEYLGAAHGYAGILSTLLRARDYLHSSQLDILQTKINELMSLQYPSGNFPSSVSSSSGDKLVHWCHGAPGFADLYLLAHEVYRDEKYLSVAERCLDAIWARGLLKKGFGLCHGVSGNGYAFLLAYKSTKNPKHYYRALRFAEWCTEFENPQCLTPDEPYSLFEGLAGNAFFLCHMLKSPSEAYFPCYSLK